MGSTAGNRTLPKSLPTPRAVSSHYVGNSKEKLADDDVASQKCTTADYIGLNKESRVDDALYESLQD